MTAHHTNPLLNGGGDYGRNVGTELAGIQLQDHCDRLNAMKGDKYWFVAGSPPSRYLANGPRHENGRAVPYATPGEVSDIMRRFGLR